MKYKVGDKVQVKSLDWYNANKDYDDSVKLSDEYFVSEMANYCGETVTIKSVSKPFYTIKEDSNDFSWTDEMFEDDFTTMKLWLARDMAVVPEDMEHYIERHPEDEIRYAKLHIFYDKPIWKENGWKCAREMGKVKNYMFPEIKMGECVEFSLIKTIEEHNLI